MSTLIKQSSSGTPIRFMMIDSTDHITGKTGLTVTVTISKNGAAFAAPSGAVSEIGSGWYKIAGNATDSNTLGPIDLHATATGADPTDVKDAAVIVAFDPTDAAALGLSRIDTNVNSRMATFTYTAPDNADIALIKAKTDNLPASPAAVGSAMTLTVAYDAAKTALPASGYTAPDNTSIAAIKAKTDNLPASPAAVGSAMTLTTAYDAAKNALAASAYTAPDNTSIAAIKTQTDKLVFTNVGKLDVQVRGMDADSVNASALAADAVTEITTALKAATIDGSYTLQQVLQVTVAALAGKLSGAGTGTITFRDLSDTKNIIVATVDATGRLTVTLNV